MSPRDRYCRIPLLDLWPVETWPVGVRGFAAGLPLVSAGTFWDLLLPTLYSGSVKVLLSAQCSAVQGTTRARHEESSTLCLYVCAGDGWLKELSSYLIG